MDHNRVQTLGVIGAGAWGTALASVGVRCGFVPFIWSRSPVSFSALSEDTRSRCRFEPDLHTLLKTVDVAYLALSSQSIIPLFSALPSTGKADIVLCSKGLDLKTGALLTDVLSSYVQDQRLFVLSGPSFSQDVLAQHPTALCLAGPTLKATHALAKALSHRTFRLYSTDDRTGVQLGGALKNVIAIACGVCDGKGLGPSARAALMTRGFSEMRRLGEALGAQTETLCGLSGLGDLMLTGTSPLSRNYSLGFGLGQGHSLEKTLSQSAGVCEGVFTTKAILTRMGTHDIQMPVCDSVLRLLSGQSGVEMEIETLLDRPLKSEKI